MPSGPGEPGRGIYKNPTTGRPILNTSAFQQEALKRASEHGLTPSAANNEAYLRGLQSNSGKSGGAPSYPNRPQQPGTISAYGGGGRGGGGGGGGGAPAGINQGQIDWLTGLLKGGQPQQQTANQLTMPQYQAFQGKAFDPSMYDQLQGNWNQALQQDRTTATQANQNLMNYLQSNYRNAFSQMPQQQQVGMNQQAMGEFLQGQGVSPSVGADVGAGGANQAFQNLWRTLGASEDMAQRNRMNTAQLSLNDVMNRINAAGLGGTSAIGLQRGQAQQAHGQRAEDRAYQDWGRQQETAQSQAMANWQRANQVSDTNVGNANSYTNSTLQALIGLLPQLAGTGLNLPDLAALGLGQPQQQPQQQKVAPVNAQGMVVI